MYDTIVVPTDGSEHALRAGAHGLQLARAFDATLHVVSVVDLQTAGGMFDAGGVDEEFVKRVESKASGWIGEVAALADQEPNVEVVTAVTRGKPSTGILEYADDHDADALLMGTHGRTGLDRYVAGSVTERVIRQASIPVLTVRATERSEPTGSYDDILVPTDGSEAARAAIDHALAVGDAFDATIHALGVIDLGTVAAAGEFEPAAATVNRLEDAARSATDAVADRAREAGLDAVTAVEEGVPGATILEYADENGVDMVTMGTHGRSGLARYIVGSTTEKIVRRAETPVLSIHFVEDAA